MRNSACGMSVSILSRPRGCRNGLHNSVQSNKTTRRSILQAVLEDEDSSRERRTPSVTVVFELCVQSKRNFASEVRRLRELSRAATAAASAAGGLPALMHGTAAAAHTAIHASLLPSLAATSRLSD